LRNAEPSHHWGDLGRGAAASPTSNRNASEHFPEFSRKYNSLNWGEVDDQLSTAAIKLGAMWVASTARVVFRDTTTKRPSLEDDFSVASFIFDISLSNE
jgi:hypothetical protein